jgi:hypothetical protein
MIDQAPPEAAANAARTSPDRRRLRRAGRLLLCVSAPLTFLLVGSLMVGHWYDLPRPELTDPVTQSSLNALRAPGERGRLAVHVLYAGCRCSERILAHLLSTQRPTGVTEKILFVGEGNLDLARVRAKGFGVERVTRDELGRRFHVSGVPLLALVGADGALDYAGGYTDSKQGPVIRDLELIETARTGRIENVLPLFGCAVSRSLEKVLDPFGLKDRGGES